MATPIPWCRSQKVLVRRARTFYRAKAQERVEAARAIQRERSAGINIQINTDKGPREIRQYCPLDQISTNLVKSARQQMYLSARPYHRIYKLARTTAELAGEADIH